MSDDLDDIYVLNFVKAKEDFETKFRTHSVDLTIIKSRFKLFKTNLSHNIVFIDGKEDMTCRLSSMEKLGNSNYHVANIHGSESDLYGKKYILDYRLKVVND